MKIEVLIRPEAEIDLDAYKKAVDIALEYDRLKNAGINVEKNSIRKYKKDGKKIDTSLINLLKAVQRSGGDPNNTLTAPIANEDDNDGVKRVRSFKKLAISLAGTITWIVNNQDFIDQVDSDKLDELENKLGELKSLMNQPDTDDEE